MKDIVAYPYSRLEFMRQHPRQRKALRFILKQRIPIVITAVCFFVITRCFWINLFHEVFDETFTTSGLKYSTAMAVNFSDLQFEYRILTEPRIERCANKTLFVFIPSRPSNFDQREAIRQTWAHPNKTVNAAFFFVLGDPVNKTISDGVEEESRLYSDVIVNDIIDSYQNLTLKTYASLDWYQTFCPEVPYALKIDDDSVVDADRLLHFVETDFNLKSKKSIFGIVWKGTRVNRNENSTWFVPREVYDRSVYPPYLNGPAYLMTAEAVKAILEKAPESPCLRVEDVFFTGVLASKAAVSRVDKRGIFWWDEKSIRVKPCDAYGVPRIATMYSYQTPRALVDAYRKLLRVSCAKN